MTPGTQVRARSCGRTRAVSGRRIRIAAWLLGALVVVGIPAKQWWNGGQRIAAIETIERDLRDELVAAQARLDLTLSDLETERLARSRLGMVRPGERAFVVAAPERDPVLPEVIETVIDSGSLWDRAFGSLGRVLRALI